MTAVARSMHLDKPPPRVLDDRLALPFAGDEGPPILEQLRSEVPADLLPAFSRWVCDRARLPEDVVERAMAHGVRQYVSRGEGRTAAVMREEVD